MHTGYSLGAFAPPPQICATPLIFKPNQLEAGAGQHAGTDAKIKCLPDLTGRMFYPVW